MADSMVLKMKMEGANKVQRELKQTGRAAKGMGKGMKGAGAGAASLGAALNPVVLAAAAAAAGLVAAAVAAKVTKEAFVKIVRETFELAERLDEIGKKAKSIGASAEDLQILVGAFQLSGVSAEGAMKSTQKLNVAMGNAMDGLKSYSDQFAKIGLEASALAKMPIKERMLAIAGGLETLGTKAEQAAVASILFGRSGKDMLVGFENRAALEAMIKDMERFHVASNEAVRNSENLQDGLLRVNKAWESMRTDALEPLIPVFTGVANGLAEIMLGLGDENKPRQFGIALAEGLIPAIDTVMMLTGEVQKALLVMSMASDIALGVGGASAATATGVGIVAAPIILGDQMLDLGGKLLTVGDDFEKINKRTAEWGETMRKSVADAVAAGNIPVEALTPGGGDLGTNINAITGAYERLRTELDSFGETAAQKLAIEKDAAIALVEERKRAMLQWKSSDETWNTYLERNKRVGAAIREAFNQDMADIERVFGAREKALRKSKRSGAPGVDPLADLKKQKEALLADAHAYEESLKTKETILKESLARRNKLIEDLKTKGLLEPDAADQLKVQFKAETDAELIALEQARADEMQRIRDEEIRKDDQRRAEEVANLKAYQQAQVDIGLASMNLVATVAGQISSIISAFAEEGNEEAAAAMKALFGITQAAALATAIVNTALAVTNALAVPPPPVGAAMAVTAGIAGATQIATIVGTTISGMAHAGLPPGAIQGANEATILMRRDEMILDPVGTRAISRMLDQRGGGQAVQVHTTLELDGQVLGRTVDDHLVRSSERGLSYQERVRY